MAFSLWCIHLVSISDSHEYISFHIINVLFSHLISTAITMVTLDQSLAVNTIQAHMGDNVEIRCDIVGNPQQPVIKWHRHNVDLNTLSLANVKVSNYYH